MENINYQRTKIIESIKLLALPYSEQIICFPDFVDVPFEVLDTFGNNFLVLPQLIENHCFSYQGIAWLLRLNNLINMLVNDIELKNLEEEQFKNHPKWKSLRLMARDTLIELGEEIGKPNRKYI